MTAKQPRQPPTLWVDLYVHWHPLPGLEPAPAPYTQTIRGALVNRGDGIWTHYPDQPAGLIQHTIAIDTGNVYTTLDLQAPTPDYQPFPQSQTGDHHPTNWQPYDSGPIRIRDARQPASETYADLQFQQQSPAARVPEALASTPGATGPLGPTVIERRPFGPRQRAKAQTKDRATQRQITINTNFATAASFWTGLGGEHRAAWNVAARFDTRSGDAYRLYLACALSVSPDRKTRLEARIELHLPTPNDP